MTLPELTGIDYFIGVSIREEHPHAYLRDLRAMLQDAASGELPDVFDFRKTLRDQLSSHEVTAFQIVSMAIRMALETKDPDTIWYTIRESLVVAQRFGELVKSPKS